MIKKLIVSGIGILILLMLAGNAGATPYFYTVSPIPDCSFCHQSNLALKPTGIFFNATHRFNGTGTDLLDSVAMCTTCHVQIFAPSNFSLTSTGTFYNSTHRYNDTTLASKKLDQPGCYNCHVDVVNGNFSLITGNATYLTSSVCQDCHKPKYDNWTNTTHRVMLTPASKAQAMNLPLPPEVNNNYSNISYMIVTKFTMYYINTTGYFLSVNDTYNTETQAFATDSQASKGYTCGTTCHTTGWNGSAVNSNYPGIPGTFAEPGIACERCHGPAGNGHQVVVNYSGTLCTQCHYGSHHGTGWENSEHYPPAAENRSSCMKCHSPFDKFQNMSVPLANTTAQSCGVCHNPHGVTDSKYADTFSNGNFDANTWANPADPKLSFFNATASLLADTDIFDNLTLPSNVVIYPGSSAGIGTGPINLTGKPVSEALCSECHYNHGLAHTNGVNLTHGTKYYGQSNAATCTDCHMRGANATVGRDMMPYHSNGIFIFNASNSASADPANTCGSTTSHCHTASSQNLSASSHSMVPVFAGWNASAHNVKVVSIGGAIGNHFYGTFNATLGFGSQRPNTCLQCKSPINWDPTNTDNVTNINLTDFHGVSCMVCHNIHDMGAWLSKTGKAYAWYNKTAILTSHGYQAAYQVMDNTTQLCGNCHTNIRAGNTGPGWKAPSGSTPKYLKVDNQTPVGTHGVPAADVFAGSWKQTGLLNFECIDCHWSTNMSVNLTDSQKVGGHSFKVNVTLLQNDSGTQTCSTCHTTASALGNLSTTIANVQTNMTNLWNNTNATFAAAMVTVNASGREKNLSKTKLAQAYWDLSMVSTEGSWGVHNPTMDKQLLADAARLANDSVAYLGQKEIVSNVTLKAGLNLVSLNGTPAVTSPASVMDSVKSNIAAVWGYNASATPSWQVYSPNAVNASQNTLTTMLPPPAAYFIYANANVQWTV